MHNCYCGLRASLYTSVGSGFSTGQWIESCSVVSFASDLLLIVPPHIRASRTVASALADNSWFVALWDVVLPVQLTPGSEDRLVWHRTSDQRYSARSAYHVYFLGQQSFACGDLLWQDKSFAKCKLFLWLALLDGRPLLKRGIDNHSTCPFGAQELETGMYAGPLGILAAMEGSELQGFRLLTLFDFGGARVHPSIRPYMVFRWHCCFWGFAGSLVGLQLHPPS
uniref:Reverse transcriptase zinc-binding domain-containing protein n=1 Tax=Oryza sativa subsp. japonica TaxID=39947 RepID=Q60EE7_ORYSJ|nr:hypothetical protein [Oryza sativa Japonica Group]